MSENLNRDFSKYEAMETKELEEILRLDAEAPEGAESDTELVIYILEVLASRRNTENITGNTAQKAWESFEENYMPENSQESVEIKISARWIRKLVAVAAAVVLLIFIPVATNALTLGEVWDIFARWAQETFSFVSIENQDTGEPSPEDQRNFLLLQEMLQENDCDPTIVPTWIPDGFSLEMLEKDITPTQEIYMATYSNGTSTFFIRIQNYLNEDFQKAEVETDYSEKHAISGVDYYFFNNLGQCRVLWVVGTYECIISGDLSIEDIKLMIDSIGKG